jgi:hypothetical protein
VDATLSVTVQVQLDASGNGQVSTGPLSSREVWNPENVHVQVSSNALEAVCQIYVGDLPQQMNYRDTTFSGSSGDASGKVTGELKNPGKVWAVWTGGDPRAYATLVVTGRNTV